MPAKRRGLPTWVFLVAGFTVFAVYFFVKHFGQKLLLKAVVGTPAELITKVMDSTHVSPRITDRTGRIRHRDFKVEKMNPKRDSLVFRYLLRGPRADAVIKLWMARQRSGKWVLYKTDTLFTEAKADSTHANKTSRPRAAAF